MPTLAALCDYTEQEPISRNPVKETSRYLNMIIGYMGNKRKVMEF
jgi:hypothetical protein